VEHSPDAIVRAAAAQSMVIRDRARRKLAQE
jgi:hypothetical protein